MRASFLIAAALLLAAPSLAQAADMAGPVAWSPNCSGLEPVDVYVPPQTAYIVACTVGLPEPTTTFREPSKSFFAHVGRLLGYGSDQPYAVVDWRYGNPATHEAKLVYLRQWSADRPPVHLIVAPK
jgi:hypothetical protein